MAVGWSWRRILYTIGCSVCYERFHGEIPELFCVHVECFATHVFMSVGSIGLLVWSELHSCYTLCWVIHYGVGVIVGLCSVGFWISWCSV